MLDLSLVAGSVVARFEHVLRAGLRLLFDFVEFGTDAFEDLVLALELDRQSLDCVDFAVELLAYFF